MAAQKGTLYNKTQPSSTNYLYPNHFNFRIQRMPSLNFSVQSCNLPGISVTRMDQPNPAHQAPLQGDRMFFGDFTMTFLVLEDMSNYLEIWDWMAKLTNHNREYKYSSLERKKNTVDVTAETFYSDSTLLIQNNAKNTTKKVKFTQMFPIQLSDLLFDTQADGSQFQKAQVTFSYKDYMIE